MTAKVRGMRSKGMSFHHARAMNSTRNKTGRYLLQAERLEEEVKTLRDAGAGGWFQTMPLPEGMAVTSSDVIASLNEHLIQVLQVSATSSMECKVAHCKFGTRVYEGSEPPLLQELSLKEDMIVKMESSLEMYRRKFAVMRHQQGLIYKDYVQEKKVGPWTHQTGLICQAPACELSFFIYYLIMYFSLLCIQEWEKTLEKLNEEIKKLQGCHEDDQIRVQEFDVT